MSEKRDLTALIALTSEAVRANGKDADLLPADDLLRTVVRIEDYLKNAQSGDPLPPDIRDMPSIQLLQIVFELQKKK